MTRRSAVTRMFYAWENDGVPRGATFTNLSQACKVRNSVWEWAKGHPRYGRRARRDAFPVLQFGVGYLQNGKRLSYCEGRVLIVLSPGERNMQTLLHELVHALGPETHGVRFQELYAELIVEFLIK